MIHVFISLTMLLVCLVSYLTKQADLCYITLEWSLLNIIVYCVRNLKERLVLLFFTFSFFVLLCSRMIISHYFDVSTFVYQTTDVMLPGLMEEVYMQLVVAVNSVYLSYAWVMSRRRGVVESEFRFDSYRLTNVRNWAKYLLYLCFLFCLVVIARKINAVSSGNYDALYEEDGLHMPFLITLFANKFDMCACLFFATMPSRKECITPMFLYGIVAILNLFTGVRGNFVLPAMFIVIYLYLRNTVHNGGEKWLTGRLLALGFMFVPVLFILMYFIMRIRSGNDMESGTYTNLALGSIYQLGSSVQVIHDTILYQSSLQQQNFYSLGPIIDFIVHNPFTDWIFNVPRYDYMSEGMALHGRSFGASITYYAQNSRFLNNGAMGTSFVAESWIDFGYWGIMFYGCLYGLILGNVVRFCKQNFWLAFIALYAMMQIIYAPRGITTAFLSRFIEVKSWPFLLLIYFVYRYSSKKIYKPKFSRTT